MSWELGSLEPQEAAPRPRLWTVRSSSGPGKQACSFRSMLNSHASHIISQTPLKGSMVTLPPLPSSTQRHWQLTGQLLLGSRVDHLRAPTPGHRHDTTEPVQEALVAAPLRVWLWGDTPSCHHSPPIGAVFTKQAEELVQAGSEITAHGAPCQQCPLASTSPCLAVVPQCLMATDPAGNRSLP